MIVFDIQPDFVSDASMLAIAAFLTERLIVHATIARQATTQKPRNPRIAPTQMKTVPSGRLDFCMNGAAAVYGMTSVGIPTPANVGNSLRWKTEVEAEDPPVVSNDDDDPEEDDPVMVEADEPVVVALLPLLVDFTDDPLVVFALADEVFPLDVAAADELKVGKSVSEMASTTGAAARANRSRPATMAAEVRDRLAIVRYVICSLALPNQ